MLPSEKPKEVISTDEQLQKRVKFWQELLYMQDWTIEAKLGRCQDMGQGYGGDSKILGCQKAVGIRLLVPGDRSKSMSPYDSESDLVHEMIHPLLDYWKTNIDTAEDDAKEWAINCVSRALVTLWRK